MKKQIIISTSNELVRVFYNAIANGGKMVKPMLYKGETEIINPQIASKENVDSVQLALTKIGTVLK